MHVLMIRKPLKTTRILAEVDDEISGAESYYANDGSSGLRDKLLSDYVSGNTERRLRSALLTGVDDSGAVDDNVPSDDAGILIFATSSSCSFRYISVLYVG